MRRLIRRFSPGKLPEFVDQRGNVQRQGDPSVFGVPDQPPRDIPIEPQPGGLRHVYSVFASRPIGAYDFEKHVSVELGGY